ncbi:hypothetical protein GCM10027590_32230 [Nocardiopsis nanhaiensis]
MWCADHEPRARVRAHIRTQRREAHMITLPHTGLQVPHTRIRVTSLKEVDVGTGIAWSAVLRQGRTRLGTIDNQGTGGMTLFRADSAAARATLAEFVAQCRTSAGAPVDQERVLDELTGEYEWSRDVARDEKKHRYRIRFFDDIGIPADTAFTLPVAYPDYAQALTFAHTITDMPSNTVCAQLWAGPERGWVDFYRAPATNAD